MGERESEDAHVRVRVCVHECGHGHEPLNLSVCDLIMDHEFSIRHFLRIRMYHTYV